jgi:hypothetical protein
MLKWSAYWASQNGGGVLLVIDQHAVGALGAD